MPQLIDQKGRLSMGTMDPVLLSVLILIVAIMAWQYVQIRSLNERLRSLERQYLALVEDLEERLFSE
jgi:Tfp pilus assembly protein PilV